LASEILGGRDDRYGASRKRSPPTGTGRVRPAPRSLPMTPGDPMPSISTKQSGRPTSDMGGGHHSFYESSLLARRFGDAHHVTRQAVGLHLDVARALGDVQLPR